MSKFQLIFIGIFILFILVGVTVFATYKGKKSQEDLPPIEIWGTYQASTFNEFVQHLNLSLAKPLRISYVQKTAAQFNKEFIETLARGGGPDAVLLPQEMVLKHEDKIVQIPLNVFSARSVKSDYIQQAESYITANGILAFPFSIDPLVMYWNRDSFTNAGVATYPRAWNEFSDLGKVLTKKDDNSNIRKSAIALGEFSNLTHGREILGTLLMQAGNPVIMGNGPVISGLANENIGGTAMTTDALSFFVKFSDPSNPDYSWNRSLPSSKNSFLSGNLATYFGFASEIADIRGKNPNLNFDIAEMPQARNAKTRVTYGNMYGLSIVRSTKDANATYTILSSLVSADALAYLTQLTYLPPVRIDLLRKGSSDPYLTQFYDSALISRSWFDPDADTTRAVFQEMVESVTSGRSTIFGAVKDADDKLNLLIRTI